MCTRDWVGYTYVDTYTTEPFEAIDEEFGAEVGSGVEYNVTRYNEGNTGHALNGVGTDAEALGRYLAQARVYNYVDTESGAQIFYDADNKILVIRKYDTYNGWWVHAYNYTSAEWEAGLDAGRYALAS